MEKKLSDWTKDIMARHRLDDTEMAAEFVCSTRQIGEILRGKLDDNSSANDKYIRILKSIEQDGLKMNVAGNLDLIEGKIADLNRRVSSLEEAFRRQKVS